MLSPAKGNIGHMIRNQPIAPSSPAAACPGIEQHQAIGRSHSHAVPSRIEHNAIDAEEPVVLAMLRALAPRET
jgi:hypothetical protein